MAPATKRNVKRQAPQEGAADSKKPKVDAGTQSVMDAILGSEDHLSPSCAKMLHAMIPSTLCVPADHRSEAQHRVVEMMQHALAQKQTCLQQAVDDATAAIQSAENEKAELEQNVQDAESAAAVALDACTSKKHVVQEAQAAQDAAANALKAAEAAQKEGDVAQVSRRAQCQDFRKVIDTNLIALSGDDLDVDAGKLHCSELVRAMNLCCAEESMVSAIIEFSKKTNSERGEFDNEVMVQVKQHLLDAIAKLTSELEDGAEAEQQRAAVVDEARQKLNDQAQAVKSAKDELLDLEVAQQNAANAVHDAKTRSSESSASSTKAAESKAKAVAALDHFNEHTINAFNALRTKASTDTPALQAGA